MISDENQREALTRQAGLGKDPGAVRDQAGDDGHADGGRWMSRAYLRRAAIPVAVLVVSLLLTLLAWQYVSETVQAREGVRFDETVRAVQGAIDRRTNAGLDATFGARSFLYASESVNRDEWLSYVEGLEPAKRFMGLQTLGYAERVEPGERGAYSRRAKREGLPVLNAQDARSDSFPVVYDGPSSAANAVVLSEDWYSIPAHRVAMDLARDTGRPQATNRILVYTNASPGLNSFVVNQPGYAVYLPVYQEGEPTNNIAERRRALRGFVFGFFRMDKLLGGAYQEPTRTVDFEVYDGPSFAPSKLLYDDDEVERAREDNPGRFSDTSLVEVAGRRWSLFFTSLDEFESLEGGSRLANFVLFTGIGVSLLLFGITTVLVRSRILAEQASRKFEDANRELQAANRELEAFSYSVSHDLRAPLRSMDGFSQILLEDYGDELDEEGRDYLGRVRAASQRMGQLIDDLLELSRVTRGPLRRASVDLSAIAASVAGDLKASDPDRQGSFAITEGLVARGDAKLLRVALENLLGNAWKFTSRVPDARVEFGATRQGGMQVYYVRDNGAGFDATYADKLFGAFQRLHSAEEFEGTGVGLATVARVMRRHGGEVWAEGEVGEGATFYFTLGGGPRPGTMPPAKE